VQLYTALALEGPRLVGRIKRDLLALLDRDGYRNIADAVGADVSN
jgi:dihydroorotate dehydrogenase